MGIWAVESKKKMNAGCIWTRDLNNSRCVDLYKTVCKLLLGVIAKGKLSTIWSMFMEPTYFYNVPATGLYLFLDLTAQLGRYTLYKPSKYRHVLPLQKLVFYMGICF